MSKVYYRPTEKAGQLKRSMGPFFSEPRGITVTRYRQYYAVPGSDVDETIKELLELGLIEAV